MWVVMCGVLHQAGRNRPVLDQLKQSVPSSVYLSESVGIHGSGIVLTGVPQLPLTTLNSVVAVCQLSADLFPAKPVQPVLVSVSVGLMNMVGAWFGAMPCCHGAGGLAAQVRYPGFTEDTLIEVFQGSLTLLDVLTWRAVTLEDFSTHSCG